MNWKERFGLVTVKGYKWLREDMGSISGNEPAWELNKWKKMWPPIVICSRGYHACRTPNDSLNWNSGGSRWFVVEAKFIRENHYDKFVCENMRIVKELPAMDILKYILTETNQLQRCLSHYNINLIEQENMELVCKYIHDYIKVSEINRIVDEYIQTH